MNLKNAISQGSLGTSWSTKQLVFWGGMVITYVILFGMFYPPIHTSMDESTYLNMAYAYRQGTQFADVAGVTYTLGFPVRGGHTVGIYPPVIPLLLAGLSYFGWAAAFTLNLILHLAIFGAVIWLLHSLRAPPGFALLYLLHPTAVAFSRTVMSDFASSLLMVLAIGCFLRRRWYVCGALIGFTVLIRHSNLIALPLLGMGCLLDRSLSGHGISGFRGRLGIAFQCGVGALPFLVAAFIFQHVVQEGGWSRIHVPSLSLSYLPTIFPVHSSSLLLLYPGMLLAPLLYRGFGKVSLLVLLYGFVFFFSCFYTYDVGSSWAETFVVRQRYLFGVIPIFIALYAAVLWRFLQHWSSTVRIVAAAATIAGLLSASAAIHFRHDRYLQKMALVRSELMRIVAPDDTLFCNMQLAKLFHPAWGARSFMIIGGYARELEVERVNQKVTEALERGVGQIVIANWSRGYRAETRFEKDALEHLKASFAVQPLSGGERGGLPDDVEVFRIAERTTTRDSVAEALPQ